MSNCRSTVVLAGIASTAFIATNLSYIRTTFLADSFTKRGVNGTLYGAVEGSYGIGNLLWLVSGLTHYLIHKQKVNLKRTYLLSYLVFVLLYVSNAWLMWIADNTVFVVVSIVDGILAGCFTMCKALVLIEAAQCWLPHLHSAISGVILTFNYVGGSVSLVLGAYLYDLFGYAVPYYTSGGLALVSLLYNIIFLPAANKSLHGEEGQGEGIVEGIVEESEQRDEEYADREDVETEADTLTPLVALPALSFALVTLVNGGMTITLTPYMSSCCNISIGAGGVYLLVYTVSAALGGVVGGLISKHNTISPLCAMIVGTTLNIAGLGIMFPPSHSLVYQYGTELVYVSMLLCGLGEMTMSSVALKAMTQVQTLLLNRTLNPQQNTVLSTMWFGGICVSLYLGRFLGGVIMDNFSFFTGGLLYMGICGIANCIHLALFLIQRLVLYRRKKQRECFLSAEDFTINFVT